MGVRDSDTVTLSLGFLSHTTWETLERTFFLCLEENTGRFPFFNPYHYVTRWKIPLHIMLWWEFPFEKYVVCVYNYCKLRVR